MYNEYIMKVLTYLFQVKMSQLFFDYGGYYSMVGDEMQWNSARANIYSIYLEERSEGMSYDYLVGRICRKMKVSETRKLKLSYNVCIGKEPKKMTYIMDDEDLMGYMSSCVGGQKYMLHVEEEEGGEENVYLAELPREVVQYRGQSSRAQSSRGQSSRAHESTNEFGSDGRVNEGRESIDELASDARDNEVIIGHNSDLDIVPYVSIGENFDEYRGTDEAEEDNVVEVEWDDGMDMCVNQEFDSKREVQDIIDLAVHQNCFEVAVVKSTTSLYVVKCRGTDCKWSVRVAKLKGSDRFSVRTYKKMHTCSRVSTSTSRKKKMGTPRLVASVLHEDYPGKFDTPSPKNLIGLVQGRLGVKVSYTTALRGKNLAVSDVRGSPEQSYTMLPSYLHMLQKMNRGTVTRLQCDGENKFKYLFIALGACIEGFKAMRKVIVIDGTFLKNAFGGVLFVATAQDPERHHYPLAFGVADGEKDASWRWFLETLKTIVPDDPQLVFVSDRNASIIKTVGEVYPNAKHGYCMWHLSQNVKGSVYGVNKELVADKFRECAQVYTEAEFNVLYSSFRKRFPKAAEYLDGSVEVSKWARCYFPGERYNINTTNCAESINSIFRDARKYSLLPMLDAIVMKISEWFNTHRKSAAEVPNTQKLVPLVAGVLHKRCQTAKLLFVSELNSFLLEYDVLGRDGKIYMVDLTRKACSCRCFDIDRYPCEHAIAAAMTHAQTADVDLHQLCSHYYYVEQWALAYYMTIYPVPHKSEWTVPDDIASVCVVPPDHIKRKGRRKETRFPSVGESRKQSH